MDLTGQPLDALLFKDDLQPVSPENIYSDPDYFHWGSSVIKGEDGQYHLFYSRWKRDLKFTAWLTHSEIAHATAPDPWGPWTYQETVLKGRSGRHWDAITAHNPKIKYFGDKYYLYYISTSSGDLTLTEEELIETAATGYSHKHWWLLRNNQRTGVAVAETLDGPWIRKPEPLIQPSGPISTLTVNPAVCQGPDGRYYLIVKGDKPNETRFIRDQAVAVSERPDGPFFMQEKPVIDYLDTEDMSLWYDPAFQHFYGVFHAHSFIGMVASEDGLNWKRATQYVLTAKKLLLNNGDTLFPDRMERPFVFYEDGLPRVLSVAVKKGDDSYCVFIPIKIPPFPQPNERQRKWQEAELGALFSYDLHVFDQKPYNQRENRITPIRDYQIFKPSQLNTDQWIKSIKDAGFTFAIFTASHETGFAFFQSEVNPYSMRALNYLDGRGDLVRDFVNSCRKYGIKPGIYLGIRWNSLLGVHDFKLDGSGDFKEHRRVQYNRMVEGMVKEICTNYGELFEIWFDGGADHPANGAPDVLPIIQQYQPDCLFYHNKQLAEARWGGSESGTVNDPCWATFPYISTGAGESASKDISENDFALLKTGDPDGKFWMPAMSDAPLRGYDGRHEWFWEPGDEDHLFPVDRLMDMYERSVGRNSTLIIGLTPDTAGLLPSGDAQRLLEWGTEIRERYADPLFATSGEGNSLSIEFEKSHWVDRVILQEEIAEGERVRHFDIEIRKDQVWRKISEGQSIGHKRIQKFKPALCEGIRVVVRESIANPVFKHFAVYSASQDK